MSDHPPRASSGASNNEFPAPARTEKRESRRFPCSPFHEFSAHGYIGDCRFRTRSLRCREPDPESVEPQSLLKQLAGIFREDYRAPFDGVVCFGGCTVCGILAEV